jgi:hypothetical protein
MTSLTGVYGEKMGMPIGNTILYFTKDSTYSALEAQIVDLTSKRNSIASQMIAILDNAFFNGQRVDEGTAHKLIKQAEELLESIDAN